MGFKNVMLSTYRILPSWKRKSKFFHSWYNVFTLRLTLSFFFTVNRNKFSKFHFTFQQFTDVQLRGPFSKDKYYDHQFHLHFFQKLHRPNSDPTKQTRLCRVLVRHLPIWNYVNPNEQSKLDLSIAACVYAVQERICET